MGTSLGEGKLIGLVCLGFMESTIVGYLMPNPVNTYILSIYDF